MIFRKIIHKFIFTQVILVLIAFWQVSAQAQNYNFTFHNGDVINGKANEKDKVKIKTDGISEVEIIEGEESLPTPPEIEATDSNISAVKATPQVSIAVDEKLNRTGVSFISGYSHGTFDKSNLILKDSDIQTFRVGLSLISSYDFNLNVEFLSNTLSAYTVDDHLTGNIPGLSVGLHNNYWLNPTIAISLGANVRGIRGEVNGRNANYKYKSFGGGLSIGPTFQIGKVQLLLAYEYGSDNVKIADNNDEEIYENEWSESSAVKGMLSLRF